MHNALENRIIGNTINNNQTINQTIDNNPKVYTHKPMQPDNKRIDINDRNNLFTHNTEGIKIMKRKTESTTTRRRRTVTKTYRGFPLGNEEYDARLLDGTIDIIDASLEQHSKVLLKRYDLHLPQETPPEHIKDVLSDVTAEMIRDLSRPRTRGVEKPRPPLDPKYMMTIEQSEADRPHAHMVLALNGNVVQSGYYPTQEMKAIVERKLGSAALLHECRNGEHMVHRGNDEELAEAVRATSYIAKVRTKEKNRGREMMRSQLKRKQQRDDAQE